MGELKGAVTGYVLAGGRSTRMGQDKALLEFGSKSLVQRAVEKLQRVVGEVRILGNRRELAAYAPLVPDLREGCGPLGGIEAALSDAKSEWVLVLPVDMPFVPSALLRHWAENVVLQKNARVAVFDVEGVLYPAMCLLHRDVATSISSALDKSKQKLSSAFREAATELAASRHVSLDQVLLLTSWNEGAVDEFLQSVPEACDSFSPSQRAATHLWFMNLNTPEERAAAEREAGALED